MQEVREVLSWEEIQGKIQEGQIRLYRVLYMVLEN